MNREPKKDANPYQYFPAEEEREEQPHQATISISSQEFLDWLEKSSPLDIIRKDIRVGGSGSLAVDDLIWVVGEYRPGFSRDWHWAKITQISKKAVTVVPVFWALPII